MILNAYGQIVEQQWTWLQRQYKYIQLDEYVIMPNHMHGIVITDNVVVGNGRDHSLRGSLQEKIKSLSELIGAFKTTSSKLIHQLGIRRFQWQKSFYDHIIRNEYSLFKIQQYIRTNPIKWELDRYYK
jgi:REP element-mobilizing transposase RayT